MIDTKAVIFDVDGTLTGEISWLTLTHKLGASVETHEKIYELYRSGKIGYKDSKVRLLGLWKTTGKANKKNFQTIFEEISLRKKAVEMIDYLKLQKYALCLITGSMDFYAATVAKELEIENYYANATLIFNAKGELIDINYRLSQAEVKKEQLLAFCKKINIKPQECAVIGDSANDYEIFKLTQKGIAFRSEFEDKILEKVALRVINDLEDIENIL